MRIVSPYTYPHNWLKGNFHTHTVASDGKSTLEEVIAMYRDGNYDFLSITDHRKFFDAAGRNAGGMLLIPGQECHVPPESEVFEYHVVGLGVRRPLHDHDSGQGIIDAVRKAGGLPVVAHPRWSYMPYEIFQALDGYAAFEVYNGGCADVDRADSSDYWDKCMTERRKPIWGVGCDDMHNLERDFGLGWTWVNAKKNPRAILDAIERGDFYASSGPRIETIRVDDSSITLHTSSASYVKFVSRSGVVLKWVEGKNVRVARYNAGGTELYVRAEVHARDGTVAWTNPFWIEP